MHRSLLAALVLAATDVSAYSLPRCPAPGGTRAAARMGLREQDAEAIAKQRWLSRLDTPQWGKSQEATRDAAAPAPAAEQLVPESGMSWLAPGLPTLTLEAADEMTNVALREAAELELSCI